MRIATNKRRQNTCYTQFFTHQQSLQLIFCTLSTFVLHMCNHSTRYLLLETLHQFTLRTHIIKTCHILLLPTFVIIPVVIFHTATQAHGCVKRYSTHHYSFCNTIGLQKVQASAIHEEYSRNKSCRKMHSKF